MKYKWFIKGFFPIWYDRCIYSYFTEILIIASTLQKLPVILYRIKPISFHLYFKYPHFSNDRTC